MLTARRVAQSARRRGEVALPAHKKNSALCHLNLEKNGLGTKGGKSIAVAVQDNHALVSLTSRITDVLMF